MNVDVLIVGQGLAGTTFAFELYRRGISFLLIDKGNEDSSSAVAAGLYNPVAYKRMHPSWNSDMLLEQMEIFFKYTEGLLDTQLLFPKNSLKIFSTEQDRDVYLKRSDPQLLKFTDGIVRTEITGIKAPFGYVKFHRTGYVYVNEYLQTAKKYFKDRMLIREETFDDDHVRYSEGNVQYKDITARKIVFCTGHPSVSVLWDHLPFRPVKGELMLVEIDGELPADIIVKDGFILPVEEGRFVVGSTYVWKNLNNEPTESGLNTLKVKLAKMVDFDYKILDHKAGVRPASHDRRPFVGWHPENNIVGILNGLGSKGVLFAPYCAFVLANSIENEDKIPDEIDVKRVSLS